MFSLVNNSVYEGGDIAEKCMTCLNGLSTFSAVIAIVIQFITYAMVTKMLTLNMICMWIWSGFCFTYLCSILYILRVSLTSLFKLH